MFTRRCHDRRMFLSPFGDPSRGHTPEESENFYGYTVARAVQKYDTAFHAGTQMGTHHHLNTTDRHGNRSGFKNSVHRNLAVGLVNKRFGRFDGVWSSDRGCDTVTPSDDETLEDLAYTDCNPVTSKLVKWAHLWPGFTTYGWRFGETRVFKRPDYYDPDNPDNPETIELTRVRPDIFPELTDDELFDKLMQRCREIQLAKQAELKANNERFVGLKKLAKTKWWRRAKTPEQRFTIIPTVASSQKAKRIAELKRNGRWRAHYAKKRGDFKAGHAPRFPYGTNFLHRIYNVPTATAEEDDIWDKPP